MLSQTAAFLNERVQVKLGTAVDLLANINNVNKQGHAYFEEQVESVGIIKRAQDLQRCPSKSVGL